MIFWNNKNIKAPLSNNQNQSLPVIDLSISYGIVNSVVINEDDGSVDEIIAYIPDRARNVKVYPAAKNITVLPLVNEYILCVQKRETGWVYLDVISNNTSIISNSKAGDINIIDASGNITFGTNYIPNDLPSLKKYEGDVLMQGRFGNSIRLGSKHAENSNEWNLDGADGTPIICVRNGKGDQESLSNDNSFLYLTSDQSLPIENESYSTYERPDRYVGSQAVIGADRIVFYSKDDNIILSSKRDVGIKTDKWNIDITTLLDVILDTVKALDAVAGELSKQAENTSLIIVPTPNGPSGLPTNAGSFKAISTQTNRIKSNISSLKTSLERMKS